jgi:hypothetical protein
VLSKTGDSDTQRDGTTRDDRRRTPVRRPREVREHDNVIGTSVTETCSVQSLPALGTKHQAEQPWIAETRQCSSLRRL